MAKVLHGSRGLVGRGRSAFGFVGAEVLDGSRGLVGRGMSAVGENLARMYHPRREKSRCSASG